ncbi:hypothetical protein BGZ83_011005 [Gryganskiella cystojenkinii]|nr:hypothetical protein BGZ83_011005 [Gryganskiella cystojenkinii]
MCPSSPSLFAIADIPELLLLISPHLSSHDLANACRVSKQWHLILTPTLWRSITITNPHAQVALLQPDSLQALYRRSDSVRALSSKYSTIFDLFRDDHCPLHNLVRFDMQDPAENDGFLANDALTQSFYLGLALVARHKYETTQRSLKKSRRALGFTRKYRTDHIGGYNDANKLRNGNDENDANYDNDDNPYDPEEPPYTWAGPFDEGDNVQQAVETHIQNHYVQMLIHPPNFNPFLNLLRHNRGLRSLTISIFPVWSERAVRAICRDGLPVLEDLALFGMRSAMVSARLLRILLEGLSPRLKTLGLAIGWLHEDDSLSEEQHCQFWHPHRRRRILQEQERQHSLMGKDNKNDNVKAETTIEVNRDITAIPAKASNENYQVHDDNEHYNLKELVLASDDMEQPDALRSTLSLLQRSHLLESLSLSGLEVEEWAMKDLAWTLFTNCPLLSTLIVPFCKGESVYLEQLLLASQFGWRKLNLNYPKSMNKRAVQAVLGSGIAARPWQPSIGTLPAVVSAWTIPAATTLAATYTSSVLHKGSEMNEQYEVDDAARLMESLTMAGSDRILVRPRLRKLESLRIEGCGEFTSMDIQTILCSCPVLRVLRALSTSHDSDTYDPILYVSDMMKPVIGMDSHGLVLEVRSTKKTSIMVSRNGLVSNWRSFTFRSNVRFDLMLRSPNRTYITGPTRGIK